MTHSINQRDLNLIWYTPSTNTIHKSKRIVELRVKIKVKWK